MLKISKPTKLSPAEVIRLALAFFGEGGEGLAVRQRDACCVFFEGGGGHVALALCEQDGGTEVTVETREFEQPVRCFLQRI